MLIADSLKRLPDLKLMIMEPFVIKGTATEANYEDFRSKTETYAAIAKKLAEEFGLTFIPLQKRLDEAVERFGGEVVSLDGVHPAIFGASIIADAWVEAFDALK
jgi:lysophospholipase L1-like esterase